jgi:hypothetical protein
MHYAALNHMYVHQLIIVFEIRIRRGEKFFVGYPIPQSLSKVLMKLFCTYVVVANHYTEEYSLHPAPD